MKTATAAPNARNEAPSVKLVDRYGEIGISAVAAAAPFTKVRKPSAQADIRQDKARERFQLSMD